MGSVAHGLVRQTLALQASAGLRHWTEASSGAEGNPRAQDAPLVLTPVVFMSA